MILNGEKPIIAVTGSAGKTMVKTLTAALLRERWIVFESNDYYNTTDKTREHAQQIGAIHRAAVLEYGMAYPGVITEHCNLLRPNIGIITNIGYAHVGNFNGDIRNLAAAKSELITCLSPSSILFTNADDQNSTLLHTSKLQGTLLKVGIENQSDYQAKYVKYTEQGMCFILTLDNNEYEFYIPAFGRHNVYNALFAIGVAHQLGLTPEEMQRGLCNAKRPKHRLDVKQLRDQIFVIDDTVHAHPTAMKAALDVLYALGKKQKIAVLGSMPELGERSNDFHQEIGAYAVSKNLDFLYTYGNISVNIGLGAIAAGLPEDKTKHFTPLYRKVLHRDLTKMIEPGSTILIKGASRLDMVQTVDFLCDYYKQQ